VPSNVVGPDESTCRSGRRALEAGVPGELPPVPDRDYDTLPPALKTHDASTRSSRGRREDLHLGMANAPSRRGVRVPSRHARNSHGCPVSGAPRVHGERGDRCLVVIVDLEGSKSIAVFPGRRLTGDVSRTGPHTWSCNARGVAHHRRTGRPLPMIVSSEVVCQRHAERGCQIGSNPSECESVGEEGGARASGRDRRQRLATTWNANGCLRAAVEDALPVGPWWSSVAMIE